MTPDRVRGRRPGQSRGPLRPLILSVADLSATVDSPGGETVYGATPFEDLCCAFCGVRSGRWQRFVAAAGRDHDCLAACPLCFLCHHLERPRIDKEAALAWLPEMSQAALNVTMREIHMELRALGEDLCDGGRLRFDTAERQNLYHAGAALSARTAAADGRLGTDKPSELAGALYRLSCGAYANRPMLLGGVRLLPLGRFYDGDREVYPQIVDAWRELAKPLASPSSGRPAPLSGA
jgi:intracellular multiplication protein IcmJ